ncbi:response regulator transcription factor, partial [Candidatus Daviesbacteria bacterium]|nr:response regulator transcription factor [Candidatus Daviesbacteria bacterium]
MTDIKKKVLVAEDDQGIADVVKTILEMNGFEVAIAVDEQTIKEMRTNLPDLLLLDLWMGHSDGKLICRNLKSQASTKHIPIILVSATRDLAKTAKDFGADDFLEKPFD